MSPPAVKSRLRPHLFRLAAVGAPLALAACSGPNSTLDPAGPGAQAIAQLWWIMLAGAAILFALVMALFALTMAKPGFGSSLSPKAWIVAGGIAMPLPILAALTFFAMMQGERLIALGDDGAPALRIEAHARMWEWEFRYPPEAGRPPSINVLHVPVGRAVEIVTTSEDVIHGFWAPRLGGKIDAIPGRATRIRILADREGVFGGLCAEYCGTGHAAMRFRVEALPQEEFMSLGQIGSAR